MECQSLSYRTEIPGSWLTFGRVSRDPWEQVDDEHCFSSTDKRLVEEDYTGFKGHAASICPGS